MDDEVLAMRALLKYSPVVLENCSINVTPSVVWHISPTDEIKEFVPRKVKRQMPGEDETVARVCTASTLLDAIRGYAVTVVDFLSKETNNAGDDDWRGGYYIYAIPTPINIQPTEKLAPISKWCDERWLVDYKQNKQPYPAKVIGQFFYRRHVGPKVAERSGINSGKFADVEVYLKLDDVGPELFPFSSGLSLGKGCHSVIVKRIDAYFKSGYDGTQVGKSKPITLSDYYKAKKVKADLLSYEPPSFMAWDIT